jgi:DNA-binding PadR family transcriptional regulator
MGSRSQPSSLSLAILGLISQEPRSGYDIRRIFTTTPMGHFSASPGAIYPALDRLVRTGLIKGVIDRKQALRPRRLYSLTDRGRRALDEALLRPVDRSDVIWRLDELLLRFAFMGSIHEQKRTLAYLESLLGEVEIHVSWLQEQLAAMPESTAPYGPLAIKHGVMTYRATARWVRHALRQLRED